ncbi:MAG: DUF3488 domain-containing protein [Planctomycetes bacterium]|nr:DUF3488 domain-containing protein [Planctomycetota bacterium]
MRDHLLAFLASALAVIWGHAAMTSPVLGAPLQGASTLAFQTLIVLALGCVTSGILWVRAPTVLSTPRRELLAGVWLVTGLLGLLIWNEQATFAQLHGYPEALLILAPTALALHSQVSFVLFLTAHGAVIGLALALRPSGGVALAFALLATALVASLAERSAAERFPIRARRASPSKTRTLRGAIVPLLALVLAFVGFSWSKPAASAATTEDWIRWLQSGRRSRTGGLRVGGQGPSGATQGPRVGGGVVPRKAGVDAPAPAAVAPKKGPARIGFSRDVKFGDLAGGDNSIAFYARVRTEHGNPPDAITFRPYWTGGALSRYTDGHWEAVGEDQLLEPPVFEDSGEGLVIEQQIVLQDVGQRALFALYPPVSTDLTAVLLDGEGCLRRAPQANAARYTVFSRPPSRRRLERARLSVPHIRYLDVPLDLELAPAFVEILEEAQAAGSSPLVQIFATQRLLSERCRYTLRPKLDPGKDPTLAFLEKGRGYCQHFASAMTLLLRSQGIPARLAVGYAGGEWQLRGGFYVVRQKHAHAWVEVPFEGRGWIVFDPASLALRQDPSSGQSTPSETPPGLDPRNTTSPRPTGVDLEPPVNPTAEASPTTSPPRATPPPLGASPVPRPSPRVSPSRRPRATPAATRASPSRASSPSPRGSRGPRRTQTPLLRDPDPFQRIWKGAKGAVGSAPPPPPPALDAAPQGSSRGGRGGRLASTAQRQRPVPENLARDSATFALGSLTRDLGWAVGGFVALVLLLAGYRAWRQRRSEGEGEGEVPPPPSVLRYGADGQSEGPTAEELHAADAVVSVYLGFLKGLAKAGQGRESSETARELARRLDLAPLHGLTELFERARYGRWGLPPDALAEVERLSAETLAALEA